MQAENLSAGQPDSVPRWRQLLVENGMDLDGIFAEVTRLSASEKTPESSPASRVAAIQEGLASLTETGQVVELRVLGIHGKKRTDSGYFNDLSKLAKAAAAYDGKAEGIYFTLNPVHPALIARAHNRVKEYAGQTTADHDIVRRITLPIDFDPVRPAGISSSDVEEQAALQRAWTCRAWLAAQGWPEPVFASSGNGAHLLYAIDLPNDAETSELIKQSLQALAVLFSDAAVKVDASTSNASRIFKLYGTLACKGDHTSERPHRRAAILARPNQREIVTRDQLLRLTGEVPTTPAKPIPAPDPAEHVIDKKAYGKAALAKELAILRNTRDGQRNNQLFQSAARLFSLVPGKALGSHEIWQALTSAANRMGLPETEAKRTIASGEDHGLKQPRLLVEEPASQTVKVPAPAAPTVSDSSAIPARTLLHVDELDALPPIRWLIKDVLPANSLVELHGAPGAGKTQVIFDMAQTLAASGQTVIYVIGEGLQGYRSRKRAWQQFRQQKAGNLFIWNQAVHLFDPPSVRTFLDTIRPKQPALIVFDTLSRCSLGADENNQKDMGFILEALDVVRRETGAAVVAVHHTNAAGARERGSTVIRGGMDAMIEVSKEDDLVVVSCAKMKDAGDFPTLYLKPVFIDIGEERPVPVLIPAERRTQTQADKLTPLQLDILRAVGMEMFAESGIKSSQLDELLPPTTKRATKYHSLNTLIRLGYISPHVKGDPYCITEAGRLKLSNTESSLAAAMSKLSQTSPTPFIWSLPDSCLMSRPIPHMNQCGMDETIDRSGDSATARRQPPGGTPTTAGPKDDEQPIPTAPDPAPMVKSVPSAETTGMTGTTGAAAIETVLSPVQAHLAAPVLTLPVDPVRLPVTAGLDTMTADQIANYAAAAGVPYPTLDGSDLYRIVGHVPRSLRDAFERGLGDAVTAYYDEVARQGQEPPELDPVYRYVQPGLVTADALYAAYQRAGAEGQAEAFRNALQTLHADAAALLADWIAGKPYRKTVLLPRPTVQSLGSEEG